MAGTTATTADLGLGGRFAVAPSSKSGSGLGLSHSRPLTLRPFSVVDRGVVARQQAVAVASDATDAAVKLTLGA